MQLTFFAVLIVGLALPITGQAEDRIDFSGVWQMDPARSESAHQGTPIGPVTLTVTQNPQQITVETRRGGKGKSPAFQESITWKFDGSKTENTGNAGVQVISWSRWNGEKLVLETARKIEGSSVTTTHVWSIDASGRELTVDKTLTVQHGYQFPGAQNTGRGTDVFIRAKQSSNPSRDREGAVRPDQKTNRPTSR